MEKIDVLTIGELNVDLIFNQIDSFPEIGKETLAGQMTLTLGSSSAICASNLSRLGAKVAFIGKLGADLFGELILQHLKAAGVDTSMVIQSDAFNTGATAVLNVAEDRAMITHQGAMEHLTLRDIPMDRLVQAKHIHMSSWFLQPGLQKGGKQLFQEAKKKGLTTSFDPQWDPREKWNLPFKELLPYVDVFLPNEQELSALTGQTDTKAAIDAIKDLANIIIVKMGSKGSISRHGDTMVHKKAFLNHQVVDAIGAGDSFNAGFIYKFIQNMPIETCQEFGNLAGAVSTMAPGGTAAFTHPEELNEIAKEKFGYTGYEFKG